MRALKHARIARIVVLLKQVRRHGVLNVCFIAFTFARCDEVERSNTVDVGTLVSVISR